MRNVSLDSIIDIDDAGWGALVGRRLAVDTHDESEKIIIMILM